MEERSCVSSGQLDTHTLHPSGQFKQKCQRFASSNSHVYIITRKEAWELMEMPRKEAPLYEYNQLCQLNSLLVFNLNMKLKGGWETGSVV